MGGKSSAPAAPDPYKTADAQSQYNKDTAAYNAALNRYNTYTPLGSQTWTQTGTDAHGAPIYRQDINLTPTAQANLDQNQQNSLNLAQTQGGLLSNVAGQYRSPMSTQGMPGIQNSVGGSQLDTSKVVGGPIQSGLQYAGPTADYVHSPMMPLSMGQRMNTSGLPQLPNADQDYAKKISDSLYQQSTQYLDPQFAQSKESLDADLANKGLVPGTQAYQNALMNYNNEKQRAYADARNQAITGGVNAMQSLYGMGLGGYNAAANTAATQAQIGNQQAGVQNAAQNQLFGQGMSNAQLQNQAQQQRFNQGLLSGQFGNEAQQQAFQQGLASQQAQNAALGQQFNQNYQNAALNNNASNQWLQQAMALYNQPLNTYNSLMTGSQVSMPNFQATPNVMSQTPDYQGAVGQNYQGQLNAYNTQVGSYNSMLNGLMNLGGTAALYFSDPRLKSNVERVGTHRTGIGIYEYDIGNERQRGVMANEVERVMPDAVKTHPSGFKMVDYAKVN